MKVVFIAALFSLVLGLLISRGAGTLLLMAVAILMTVLIEQIVAEA